MAPETATDVAPNTIEVRLAGGILALNRFTMTLQNKRMPVTQIKVDGDAGGTGVIIALDCPEETARRYAALLESLEDVEEIRLAERPAPK